MTRNLDELSNLTTRSVEPEKYFGEMDLDEEQVEERIEYTKKANVLYDTILLMFLSMMENDSIDYVLLRSTLITWLLSLIAEYVTPDDYLIDYATDAAYNFIETTQKHIEDPWYTSPDRALFNAENSANDVLNYSEYQKAIEAGKTHKKWITEHDKKVRDTHKELHNKVIPIKEYFRVGIAKMRFPKDYEYASMFPEEIVNCRCTIEYLPKTSDEKNINSRVESEVISDDAKRNSSAAGEASRFLGYENNTILANEKYINSEEYRKKFNGVSISEKIDDIICEFARKIAIENSGTLNESLVVLNKNTGDLIAYSSGSAEEKVVYTEEVMRAISNAKEERIEMISLHNHPRSTPPSADDCVSALNKGYSLGFVCGSDGRVEAYIPAEIEFSEKDCEDIHRLINDKWIDTMSEKEYRKIWKETLSEFGMNFWEKS